MGATDDDADAVDDDDDDADDGTDTPEAMVRAVVEVVVVLDAEGAVMAAAVG